MDIDYVKAVKQEKKFREDFSDLLKHYNAKVVESGDYTGSDEYGGSFWEPGIPDICGEGWTINIGEFIS